MQEGSGLQIAKILLDLEKCKLELLHELSEIDTAIKVIKRTLTPS